MHYVLIALLASCLFSNVNAFAALPRSPFTRICSGVRTRLLSDDKVDLYNPEVRKISVKSFEELVQDRGGIGLSAGLQIPDVTAQNVTSKTFGINSAEELQSKEAQSSPTGELGSSRSRKANLNGIKPWTPFVYAIAAAVMSAAGWQVCSYLATHFATSLVDSPTYQLQRAAIIARNLVVGITALFTGFSGVIAAGLLLLGTAVVVGVLKGELNPDETLS